jgi:multimeric flavodoxin WrbA
MTILGSPRRRGNTAKVLGWIEEQLQAAGHEVDHVDIVDYDVHGCGECMACKKGTIKLCSVQDDANALFHRMVTADAVLFAAPVFCWGFPAQLKALIDRTFCLMDFEAPPPGAPRLNGKPVALLLTAGGDEKDNTDLVVRGFEQLVQYLKATPVRPLLVTSCTTPDALGDDVKARAVDFAATLVQAES